MLPAAGRKPTTLLFVAFSKMGVLATVRDCPANMSLAIPPNQPSNCSRSPIWQSQLPPCKNFADLLEVAESLRLAAIPGDDRDCQGNAARCALELAILDAYGRAFGEPLSNVAKVLTPELYDFKSWVRYSGAITSAKGMKARLAAWKMWIYGFKQLKIKVGIEGQDDVARLRSIRKRSGKKMDLRIDANEAWSASSSS